MASAFDCGISVLTGGLSSRMGVDKSQVRVGRRTLLGHVRVTVRELGLPIRLIQKDSVDRCGPLGGLFTALESSRREAEVFLACDMPFVSPAWLRRVMSRSRGGTRAVFTVFDGMPGFPCLLPCSAQDRLQQRIGAGELSIRGLCQALGAARLDVTPGLKWRFFNVNTADGLEEARRIWRTRGGE